VRKSLIVLLSFIMLSGTLASCHEASPNHDSREAKEKNPTAENKRKRTFESQATVLANGITVWGLRKFPYPYKAMLAISSDADHETLRKFNLIHEFINTTQETPLGKGLGLDFADSFFMYNGSNVPLSIDYGHTPIDKEFTYFKGVTNQIYGGKIIDKYIHDGWIDTIHSFGDFTQVNGNRTLFRRQLAVQAIDQLKRSGDYLTVWTDHGNRSNVDNFGSYGLRKFYDYQRGATPSSPYYHTDLTIPYGVKFVWTDVPNSSFGYSSIIYPLKLPDGQKVWGFARYTGTRNRRGDPMWLWSVDHLAQQLTWKNMRSIIWQRQYAIVAQHLCADNSLSPLPKNAIDALKMLAFQFHKGNILVARTSRLLQYNVTQHFLRYNVTSDGDKAIIHILSIADPVFGTHTPTIDEIRGVTFYTSDPHKTVIEIGNTPIPNHLIQYNPKDYYEPSISVKWYPPDTKNYAINDPSVY
jgi:hypothetical protein